MNWNKAAVIKELDTRNQIKGSLVFENDCCFLGAVAFSMGAEVVDKYFMKLNDDGLTSSKVEDSLPDEIRDGFTVDSLLNLDIGDWEKAELSTLKERYGGSYLISAASANDTYGITFSQFKQLIQEYCNE